ISGSRTTTDPPGEYTCDHGDRTPTHRPECEMTGIAWSPEPEANTGKKVVFAGFAPVSYEVQNRKQQGEPVFQWKYFPGKWYFQWSDRPAPVPSPACTISGKWRIRKGGDPGVTSSSGHRPGTSPRAWYPA